MNENLDLTEILKDAQSGTKLWSPICGVCYFKEIREGSCTPIVCRAMSIEGNFHTVCFTKEGRRNPEFENGVCVLFPSEENRDWSTFKAPKKHKEFKPFQKVLCAVPTEFGYEVWNADIYSHYDEFNRKHFLISGFAKKDDDDIIPYEGNEDKLGKTVE